MDARRAGQKLSGGGQLYVFFRQKVLTGWPVNGHLYGIICVFPDKQLSESSQKKV